jgi:UDP-N-acetyl-D-glucosamine dehydrogenase
LKLIFERMGIDVWEVIEAARTKPFGYQAFYPGRDWAGTAFPIDPLYCRESAAIRPPHAFIELAAEINTFMRRIRGYAGIGSVE